MAELAGISKKLPRGKAFQPGASGNPVGRPKRTEEEFELIAACKSRSPAALAVIEEIMINGESDKTRLAAAIAVIERAYGKPVQDTNTTLSGSLDIRNIRVEFVDAPKR